MCSHSTRRRMFRVRGETPLIYLYTTRSHMSGGTSICNGECCPARHRVWDWKTNRVQIENRGKMTRFKVFRGVFGYFPNSWPAWFYQTDFCAATIGTSLIETQKRIWTTTLYWVWRYLEQRPNTQSQKSCFLGRCRALAPRCREIRDIPLVHCRAHQSRVPTSRNNQRSLLIRELERSLWAFGRLVPLNYTVFCES